MGQTKRLPSLTTVPIMLSAQPSAQGNGFFAQCFNVSFLSLLLTVQQCRASRTWLSAMLLPRLLSDVTPVMADLACVAFSTCGYMQWLLTSDYC